MTSYLNQWLGTLEAESPLEELPAQNNTPFPVWTFYTNCTLFLSELQSTLANSSAGLLREDAKSLKDELIKLRLWGDGYDAQRLERLLDHSTELKSNTISLLVEIGSVLTDSE